MRTLKKIALLLNILDALFDDEVSGFALQKPFYLITYAKSTLEDALKSKDGKVPGFTIIDSKDDDKVH